MRSKRIRQAEEALFCAMLSLFARTDTRRDAARSEYKARREVEVLRDRMREVVREEKQKGGEANGQGKLL